MNAPISSSSPWGHLTGYDIILGSQSPRRVELLAGLGVPFRQMSLPDLDESYDPTGLTHEEIAIQIAEGKARAYESSLADDTLLITADTIVVLGDEILGKPRDRADAERILRMLSGRTHVVVTGVCLWTRARRESFACSTEVNFATLTEADIAYYLDVYAPYDKAGAYGIQEWIGYRGISGIRGSFYNVMGLPVHQLSRALDRF